MNVIKCSVAEGDGLICTCTRIQSAAEGLATGGASPGWAARPRREKGDSRRGRSRR